MSTFFKKPQHPFQYYFSTGLRSSINRLTGTWRFYAHHVDHSPRITASLTGGTLWATSDLYVQKRIDKCERLDWGRFAGAVVFGFVVTGFFAFYWYTFLEHLVHHRLNLQKGTLKFVASKVGLELGIFAPGSLFLFWLVFGACEGKKYGDILEQMGDNNTYWESLKVDWMIWLPVDIFNFWMVRVRYQILVVNLGCFFEAVILGEMEAKAARREEEEEKKKKISEVRLALEEHAKMHKH